MSKVNLPEWFKEVQTTDKKYVKEVRYGKLKFNAINAHYQLLKATEVFGLYGDGFGLSETIFDTIRDQIQKPLVMTLDAVFYYSTGEKDKEDKIIHVAFPISSEINFFDGNGKLVSDMRKKLTTDCMTKALSKIGFSSDIFLGMWDDDKYVDSLEEEPSIVKKKFTKTLKNQMVKVIKDSVKEETLDYVHKRIRDFKVSENDLKELNELMDTKKEEFKN